MFRTGLGIFLAVVTVAAGVAVLIVLWMVLGLPLAAVVIGALTSG